MPQPTAFSRHRKCQIHCVYWDEEDVHGKKKVPRGDVYMDLKSLDPFRSRIFVVHADKDGASFEH